MTSDRAVPEEEAPDVDVPEGSIFDQEVAELGKLLDIHEGVSKMLSGAPPPNENRADRRKRERLLKKRKPGGR